MENRKRKAEKKENAILIFLGEGNELGCAIEQKQNKQRMALNERVRWYNRVDDSICDCRNGKELCSADENSKRGCDTAAIHASSKVIKIDRLCGWATTEPSAATRTTVMLATLTYFVTTTKVRSIDRSSVRMLNDRILCNDFCSKLVRMRNITQKPIRSLERRWLWLCQPPCVVACALTLGGRQLFESMIVYVCLISAQTR